MMREYPVQFCESLRVRFLHSTRPVFFFKDEAKAKDFMIALEKRVNEFDLILNKDKTHILRLDKENHESFDFLGLTFYWGKQHRRKALKVKTQKKKLIRGINEFDVWIKRIRNRITLQEIWKLAKLKIVGHINYYGYAVNNLTLNHFYQKAIGSLYKWLNRRSQKRSYTWEGFSERIKNFPLIPTWKTLKLKQLGQTYGY